MKKRLIVSLIFFIFLKEISLIEINRAYVENPLLYKNEICSFNGDPIIVGNNIECSCYSSYVDEPRESHRKYIGNQLVRCSYKKKKRFRAFVLSCIFPLGLDYLYLGYYLYFSIIFFFFILLAISQICFFILSYKVKEITEETMYKYNDRTETFNDKFDVNISNKRTDKKKKLEKCLFIYFIINRVLIFTTISYWVTDIIFQATGKVRDPYGIETENDFFTLFSKEQQ